MGQQQRRLQVNWGYALELTTSTQVFKYFKTLGLGTYLVVTFDFRNVERLGGPVARYFNLLLFVEPNELSRGRLDEILKHFQVG